MPRFVLLLEENPAELAHMSPEEMQRCIERYSEWSAGLAAAGKLMDGMKLKDEGGRRLSREQGAVRAVDGPYVEAKEVIGGLFVIEASDYAEAEAIAADCPHLELGRILVREIDPV